jgi:uncharacterized protein (TIGR02722 family)
MNCKFVKMLLLSFVLILFFGCASSGTKVRYGDPRAVETVTADFGSTDLHMIAEKMVNSLVMSPVLDGRPVVFVDEVRNKTHEHIDTKAITNKIRTTLLKHGKVKITGRSDIPESILREQDFQRSNLADPKTIAKMGKLAGAKYILHGDITSIVKQSGRVKDVWFKITLNLTNVEDGLIEWADDKEIRKVAKKRSVGW